MGPGFESLKVHQQAVPAPKPWFIQVIKFSCQKIRKQGSAEKSVLQSVFLTQRVHPYPFRTRKLSSAVVKILYGKLCGKIAQCRHFGKRGRDILPFLNRSKRRNYEPFIWGCSSAGRAPALQAGGHGFESHHLHQVIDIGESLLPSKRIRRGAVVNNSLNDC